LFPSGERDSPISSGEEGKSILSGKSIETDEKSAGSL